MTITKYRRELILLARFFLDAGFLGTALVLARHLRDMDKTLELRARRLEQLGL